MQNGKISFMKSIGGKIMLICVLLALISIGVVTVLSILQSSSALMASSFNQLKSVRGIKKSQIERYFDERRGDMGVLMETVGTLRQEAFSKLEGVRENRKAQIGRFFAEREGDALVLADNPHVLEAYENISVAFQSAGGVAGGNFTGLTNGNYEAPAAYRNVHNRFYPTFLYYMEQYGYYDLFLMDPEFGDVIFTVTKEEDFGMRANSADSGLRDAWSVAVNEGRVGISDTRSYAPSAGAPAQFIAAPIRDGGRIIGVVALQISIDAVNLIMQERSGMGETGEAYIVGPDHLMRSDSYLDPVNHTVVASFANPDKGSVDSEAVAEALAGKSSDDVIIDYNGNPVLSSYAPVTVGDTTWAVIVEIDVAEAFCPKDENGTYFYAKYIEKYGYYDLFLMNPDGFVFYTVTQEADYQTNMVDGKYSDSNLGKLTRNVLSSKNFGFADFEPYSPSGGVPAAFIAQPVMHGNEVEAIVALQLPLEGINDIMQERTGMGESGETYLVGSDKLMRSDSFIDSVNHTVVASFNNPNRGSVDTDASREALAGNDGAEIILDYTGNPVLSAYTQLDLYGTTQWAIIAEINESEVREPVNNLILFIVVSALVMILIAIVAAVMFSRTISKPILLVVDGADSLSIGDIELTGMDSKSVDKMNRRGDELGAIGKSFNKLIEYQKEKVGIAQEIAEKNLQIDASVSSEKDTLGKAYQVMTNALNDVLGQVDAAVDQVGSGSNQVSQASQSLSQGAAEQASSLEEISSSLNEINSQSQQNADSATEAVSIAKQAVTDAEEGNMKMEGLVTVMERINTSSEEINKVVKAIDDIAFQINLLALNANVEAARAGKYGKGFAVVADEVRNLAVRSAESVKETSRMVEETTKNISEGTQAVTATAEQLEAIVQGATKVADYLSEIASASKDQAMGVQQTNSGLEQIDQVTQSNTANAEETASASEELAAQAQQLRGMISQFRLKNGKSNANSRATTGQLRVGGNGGIQSQAVGAEARIAVSNGSGKADQTANGDGESDNGGTKVALEDPKDVISLDEGFKDF